MDSILCISYNPFTILEWDKKMIKTHHYVVKSFYQNLHPIKYNIFCIFYYDYSNFFITSNEYIYQYECIKNKLIEKDKIYVGNDIIRKGMYDKQNERLYGFINSNINVYCLKTKKKICRFYNVNKIIINKYRYYYFPRKYFLMILQSLYFCIFSTKKHIKRCCSLIWEWSKSTHFQCRGIFRDKYIFTTEKEFITIDRNSFLMEVYDISDYITNKDYNFLLDYFLYLICYSHEGNILKLNYFQYDGIKFTFLFHHEVFLSHGYRIEKIKFYSFQEYHFIYIKTNIEHKLFFLFHFSEKLSKQIIIENENNSFYEKQLKIYNSILYKKNVKIENDTLKKELSKCCICYENNVSILFLPCAHICCCNKCIFSIEKCPVCRELILYKKNCYILTN